MRFPRFALLLVIASVVSGLGCQADSQKESSDTLNATDVVDSVDGQTSADADNAQESIIDMPDQTSAMLPKGANVLLLIADDLGIDKVGVYTKNITLDKPPITPNIDRLAARGMLFQNAYAYTWCSPTRASILTGRYGRRTGVGTNVVPFNSFELPLKTLAIPKMLKLSEAFIYDTSLTGKWHVGSYLAASGTKHPGLLGFSWHAGSFSNLDDSKAGTKTKAGYYDWEKNTNGTLSSSTTYATTDTVNDAIGRIKSMKAPWFLWVSFNAPHVPWQVPPKQLHPQTPNVTQQSSQPDRFRAIVEALDTEIGRLLASMDEATRARTVIIFIGDNGSDRFVITRPWDNRGSKGTLYEGGIRVPFIVAGPGVKQPGSVSKALVHTMDIYATVAEIAGVDVKGLLDPNSKPLAIDGISILPYLKAPETTSKREYLFGELVGPVGGPPYTHKDDRTIRDARWKLIVTRSGVNKEVEQFFDLQQGEFKATSQTDDGIANLLKGQLTEAQRKAYQRLKLKLTSTLKEMPYQGF